MYKQDVTSAQLLSWFAPLDVAERYEKNRGIGSNDIFYNCSSPWFGSHCQYKFEGDIPSSFDKIIYGSFRQRSSQCLNTENSTCYPFLSTCDRGPSPICLDWREICDDKPDCINGEDEQFCDQLESSECSPKEYRCHYGGQCIPLAFLFDGENNLDCLDGSDEGEFVDRILDIEQRKNCMNNPLFECEERRCRDRYSFSCGDGECSPRHLPITFDYHCYNHRTVKLIRTVLDSNMDCQQTLLCLLGLSKQWTNHCSPPSIIHYPVNRCHSLASQCHSEWITIPQQPILFGFFQFIYLTNRSIDEFEMNILPDYICFDSHRCPGLLQFIVVRNLTNGLSCCHRNDLPDEIGNATVTNFYMIEFVFEPLIQRCLTIGREDFCSDSSLFYCSQSMKCISYHRLVDGMRDCFFGEDESYDACSLNDSSRFVCQYDRSTCLAFIAFSNGVIDCVDAEDELLNPYLLPSKFDYIYSLFCDGFIDRLIINDSLVDETNCEYWPCNTPYVRCDNVWQCLNGMDELNCPDSRWPANQHACSLKNSSDFVCLPIEYLYDTVFNDCPSYPETLWRRIYFNNQTKMNINESLAWHNNRCITREKLCRSNSVQSEETFEIGCPYVDKSLLQIEENIATYHGEYVCHEFPVGQYQNSRHYFLSSRLGFFPPPSAIPPITTIVTNDSQVSNNYTIDIELNYHCYRGIFLRFGPSEGKKCFCPPSSFGDQCQWQSQRVSLTLQFIFRSVKFGINVFQIILMLIDENGRIAPNIEQLTFIPVHDCGIKYNLYLLYPDRPKNSSKNYSVHIDVFDRLTLNYHVSWHLSIPYSFLPVNRLAAQLIIPDQAETEDCQLDCGHHGRCRRYANKRTLLFCLCDPGYSGLACNETHRCSCVIGARCHAPSFCLCPFPSLNPVHSLRNPERICQDPESQGSC
ncbi:unnamed protein product [Rotaria sp. Silwood2]|nr:unnamed protein product [Rotaria sp. Silwood2]